MDISGYLIYMTNLIYLLLICTSFIDSFFILPALGPELRVTVSMNKYCIIYSSCDN